MRSMPDGRPTSMVMTAADLVGALAFRPDNRFLAIGGGGRPRRSWCGITQAGPDQPVIKLKGPGTVVWSVAFADDKPTLAYARQRPIAPAPWTWGSTADPSPCPRCWRDRSLPRISEVSLSSRKCDVQSPTQARSRVDRGPPADLAPRSPGRPRRRLSRRRPDRDEQGLQDQRRGPAQAIVVRDLQAGPDQPVIELKGPGTVVWNVAFADDQPTLAYAKATTDRASTVEHGKDST